VRHFSGFSNSSQAGTTFAALHNRNYAKYYVGQGVSQTGTWMQSVATGWLVLELTNSGTWLGFVIALQFLPVLIAGPYAGLLVDRWNKRRVLYGTQISQAILALLLGVMSVTHRINLGTVLLLAVLLGFVNAIDAPARQAFLREMVPTEDLRNAITLNSVLINVARVVGPSVAGVLIAYTGVGGCFLVNAASFSAVILAFALMEVSKLHTSVPEPRAPGQVREGLRYVRATPALFIPLLMLALIGTLTYEFQVVLPIVARQTFHADAKVFGLLTSAMGGGAVIGGLVTARRSVTGVAALAKAAGRFGVVTILAAAMPTVTLELAALVLVGAASIGFLATGNATLQLASRPEMRGRVMALWTVAFLGTTPVGGPIAGFVAAHFGARWALALGGTAALVAAGIGFLALHGDGRRELESET
jgi:MFS family permease